MSDEAQVTYKATTFSNVQKDIEQYESNQVQEPVATTEPEPQPNPDTQITPEVNLEPTPSTEPVAEPDISVSDFNIPFEGEPTPTPEAAAQPQTYNWKEEIKKVDKKELLKEAGVHEFAAELNDYLLKGGKAEDYLNARAIDYNKVTDEDLLKSDLKKQYPNFTAQQINLMYDRKYLPVSELDEDKEFADLQKQADAYNVRTKKIAEQQTFKIPDTPILQKDEAYEQWKQSQESQPQLMQQFRNFYDQHEATKNLYQSKRVAVSLGDGVPPFNFNINQPEIITKAMTDGGAILNKATATQTGEPDVAKQQLITLFSLDPLKYSKDIFEYGKKMGVRKELVENGQNAQRPQAKVIPNNEFAQKPTYGQGKFGDKQR